jgi:two-component system OmpR family sensor kinase
VFDRFYRGTDARAVSPDGSGLGLSIARAIADRHAASISVSETTASGGCTVEVTFAMIDIYSA